MAKIRKTLSEFLTENEIISTTQLQTAHLESDKTGEALSHVLVRLGMVPEDKILEYYTEHCHVPKADLAKIDPETIKLVPEKTARRYHLIPVEQKDKKLVIAMSDPLNIIVLDEIRFRVGMEIE
ncbi:MAG: type II secretion system protein GspE, partial [Candidatus Margulisiibacteriota bacterium]